LRKTVAGRRSAKAEVQPKIDTAQLQRLCQAPRLCRSQVRIFLNAVIIRLVHKLTVLHQFKLVRHSGELA